ncbi:glycosyltransferase family 2 protein [Candidatus Woesearchaeota archaeon]|nr:glycosyltransferase family 2 protein [Candidatus Woesearchaeota archaeon]
MKTLAVLPAFNEEGKVGNSIMSIKPYVDKVLVINDGSTDNTEIEAKKQKVIVISHKKNLGIGAAFKTAIRYAQKNNYDVCIHFATDFQDDGSYVPEFIKKIKQGYDFVQGSRYLKGGKRINHPLFRIITTYSYSLVFSIITGRRITDATNGFRAYRTDIFKNKNLNIWQDWLNRYELEPYFFYKVIKENYKVTEIPVLKRYPKNKNEGYTKMKPFKDWWRITKPLIYLRLGLKK